MTKKQLGGYTFADKESKAAALEALACIKQGRRGAFVLDGPPGTGKTHFVRECLAPRFGDAMCAPFPRGEVAMDKTLSHFMELGYVWFDDVGLKINSGTLDAFITSPTWPPGRLLRQRQPRGRKHNCVVFVCGIEVTGSPDFLRRVKVIRLAEPRKSNPQRSAGRKAKP